MLVTYAEQRAAQEVQRLAQFTQVHTQQQIDHAMAPFTITMEKLVSTVAQPRGANRLKELLDSMKSQS